MLRLMDLNWQTIFSVNPRSSWHKNLSYLDLEEDRRGSPLITACPSPAGSALRAGGPLQAGAHATHEVRRRQQEAVRHREYAAGERRDSLTEIYLLPLES